MNSSRGRTFGEEQFGEETEGRADSHDEATSARSEKKTNLFEQNVEVCKYVET